ncbi:MAG: peptide chain release factor N(5)-glutamine methyltransferase [Elusimicrobia bacterium]|nr:peptide chain release factor N(5)-glutamine methyltransferase [Elusimicrobiota bacterium]
MKPIELLNYGKEQLGKNKCYDARILLEHCLKLKPSELYLSKKNIKTYEKNLYRKLLNKKEKGLPTAYITEKTEFMGLEFHVNKNVLVPRQETENLVEEVIKILNTNRSFLTILDIGTGSGNIAISLAKYVPNARIVATDISKEALTVAKINAKSNGVSDKITFIQSNLFDQFYNSKILKLYDCIISNPPYIKTAEIKRLQKEIQHEPAIALDGGYDGLRFYREIISSGKGFLRKNGFLVFEIGYYHSKIIREKMRKNGFKNIKVKNDYLNQERIIYGQNNN